MRSLIIDICNHLLVVIILSYIDGRPYAESRYKCVSVKDFTIPIGDDNINPTISVRNLGVVFR